MIKYIIGQFISNAESIHEILEMLRANYIPINIRHNVVAY